MSKLPPAKQLSFNNVLLNALANESQKSMESTENSLKVMIQVLEECNSKNELQTFKNPDYAKEAIAIAPKWVYLQTSQENIEKFRYYTTYDYKHNILIIKIYDHNGNIISYKKRRGYNGGKWITAKGTHPNNQCMIQNRAKTDKDGNFLNHIYVVEGHHDFLTAVLLGIDVLMIPTVNYKQFMEYELTILKNRDVIFLPDWKEDDLSGVEAMERLARQITDITRNVKVFSLPLFLESENINFNNDKLDLSEVVELWNDGLDAFVNTLEYAADKNIFYIGEIF